MIRVLLWCVLTMLPAVGQACLNDSMIVDNERQFAANYATDTPFDPAHPPVESRLNTYLLTGLALIIGNTLFVGGMIMAMRWQPAGRGKA